MSTVTTLAELRSQRRAGVAADYIEILKRHASPREGDVERLAVCMDALKRSDADLQADIEITERLAICESLAAELDARTAEEQQCNAAHGAAIHWSNNERQKLELLIESRLLATDTALKRAVAARGEAKDARGELALLRDKLESICTGRRVEEIRRERIAAGAGHAVRGPSEFDILRGGD